MKKLLAATLVGTILVGLGVVSAQTDGAKAKRPRAPSAFQKRDTNGDGVLTPAEFMGKTGGPKAQARFQRLDKDHDGRLTRAEFNASVPKKKNNPSVPKKK